MVKTVLAVNVISFVVYCFANVKYCYHVRGYRPITSISEMSAWADSSKNESRTSST